MMQRMICHISLGQAEAVFVVDNVSYSPDVATDVANRAIASLREAVLLSSEYGVPATYFTDAEGEDDLAAILSDLMEDDEDA